MKNRRWTLYILASGMISLAIIGGIFHLLFLSPPSSIAGRQGVAGARSRSTSLTSLKASVPRGAYNYGGSATMVPIRQVIEPIINQTFPKFQLSYISPAGSAPTSTSGINMLLEGKLAFSDSSRVIRPEEFVAAEQAGDELQQIPVAIDGIVVVVHPELTIEGLTLAQLSDIFTGRITNWSEVGGPELDIRPYSMLPSTSGTASFFLERILNGIPLAERVEIVGETTPVLRQIASRPGSIYYVSAPLAVPQCSIKTLPIASAEGRPFVAPYQTPAIKASDCPEQRNQINKSVLRNGTYPLTRRLFVVAKKGESDEAAAGQAYSDILLSAEGQSIIEEAGFVNIR